MRGLVSGLPSPHPVAATLPGLYLEDDLGQRFVAALDETLAPVFATLDAFPAYLDPAMTPEDVLDWLAGWVGMPMDQTWPIERRRALVASAVELYRSRGTASGLAAQVALFTGGDVEISESGAAGFSVVPNAAVPGQATADLLVRISVSDPKAVDATRVDALVRAAKPAHVPHRIEIVKASGPSARAS
ncbi:MAG: phage tail protein [Chloroflexi bacterium]|nr:phage tail protein [Chloroflexota bacterium]